MEAEQVLEKIRSDAQRQADEILSAAREQASDERARLQKDLDAHKQQTDTLAKQAAAEEKAHLLAAARMEVARKLLAEKRALLDGVFAEALKRLQGLPDEAYRNLASKLMLEAVETGEEEVILDRHERRIGQDLIAELNRRLSEDDRRGAVRLSDQRLDLGGGFVLRRGKIMTNVSFAVLMEQARKELEIELAGMLFG
ncbi:MAG TPA: hypothetical protein ENN81_13520 [Phycisphaerales bacterium]|nr:hypothetical protein [Phycisphaerales bacterium]